jgi:hypothetical protein
VDRILRDAKTFSNGALMSTILSVLPPDVQARAKPLADLVNGNMMNMTDAPQHTRLRRVVAPMFMPSRVKHLRDSIVQSTNELLDEHSSADTMDVITALAEPLPRRTLTDFLGVDREYSAQFAAWSDDFVAFVVAPGTDATVIDRSLTAFEEMSKFVADEIERRKGQPSKSDDVLGVLATAQESEGFTRDEVVMTCVQFVFAGATTTTGLIGNALFALLDNPGQFELLRQQPSLASSAIEETLRFESPVRFDLRAAAKDATIDHVQVHAGDTIMLSLAAANRDPSAFSDPNRFDITRRERAHLAFAVGPHLCVGASLARLQGEVVLTEIARRLPALEIADSDIRWKTSFLTREAERLDVRW